MVKKFRKHSQNVCHNSYYLNCKQTSVAEIHPVFRDMSLFLLWLFMSLWMSAHCDTYIHFMGT